jgi:hypothetical protein
MHVSSIYDDTVTNITVPITEGTAINLTAQSLASGLIIDPYVTAAVSVRLYVRLLVRWSSVHMAFITPAVCSD